MFRFWAMEEAKQREGRESKEELAEERTELAEERTIWADQRTYLAQQRTFAGWIRTGLATTTVGFAVIRFIGEENPKWLIELVGLALILLGALIPVLAMLGYRRVDTQLRENDRPGSSVGMPWLWLIAMSMSAIALAAAAFVIL